MYRSQSKVDFNNRLRQHKEADIEAMFGKPMPKADWTFAMPVAQPRGFGMSGLRHVDEKLNKDHKGFYLVGTFAALEIYYTLDGVSPNVILHHFRVDDTFPRLTKDNLRERLRWEQDRWQKLEAYYEKRLDRVSKKAAPDRPALGAGLLTPPPGPNTAAVPAAQLREWWDDLEKADERRIYQVIDRLAAVPEQSIPFLSQQMPPDPKVEAQQLSNLIRDLGSDRFADRSGAMRELEALNWLAKPALEAALPDQATLETAMRIRQLLAQMEVERSPALRRTQRAVLVLAAIDTPAAHRLLRQWAARAPAAFLTQEAGKTLAWLEGRSSR
jgi:hypothetical protein